MTEFRFHHLERRRIDQALPDLVEQAYAEGRRVVVQTASDELVAALSDRLWTFDDASFLPHGATGDGDPAEQPIFITSRLEKSQWRHTACRGFGRRCANRRAGGGIRAGDPSLRRPRRRGAQARARRLGPSQSRGSRDQLLARRRGRRLAAGALTMRRGVDGRQRKRIASHTDTMLRVSVKASTRLVARLTRWSCALRSWSASRNAEAPFSWATGEWS